MAANDEAAGGVDGSRRQAPARPALRRAALIAGAALIAAATALTVFRARRSMLRGLRVAASAQLPPKRAKRAARPAPGARRVRVLLVAGLTRARADTLPRHRQLCRAGLRADVDVGYPTASFAVQHALWTGIWQAQSGYMTVRGARTPRGESLPAVLARRSGTAVAVAESRGQIVKSFGFTRTVSPRRSEPPLAPLELSQAALLAARSSSALVFVHVVAVDAMAHQLGVRSAAYARASSRADALLGALADVRRPGETLIALSDHGHIARGGHGGGERSVRLVRACVVGPGIAAGTRGMLTIVDINRLISDRVGLSPLPRSQGRALAVALASKPPAMPLRAASLPSRALGMIAAVLIALLAMGLGRQYGGRVGWLVLPWALVLGVVVHVSRFGWPTLSHREVFPYMHRAMWTPVAFAVPVALAQLWALGRRLGVAKAGALLTMSLGAASAVLLGFVGWPLRAPAVTPMVTALASITAAVAAPLVASLAPAVALLGLLAPRWPVAAAAPPRAPERSNKAAAPAAG